MDLRTAAYNAFVELRNIHREYLHGQGGCPCTEANTYERCPVKEALDDLEAALVDAGETIPEELPRG